MTKLPNIQRFKKGPGNPLRVKTPRLIVLLVIVNLLVVPASAKSVDYRANGKLDEYGYGEESAMVLNGRWSVKVKGDDVDFKAFYRELNLVPEVEQSPEGTIDEFWLTLVNVEYVEITGDTCYVVGDFEVVKKWWILPEHEDYPPPVKWLRGEEAWFFDDVAVEIDSAGIQFHFFGGLKGPTLSIHYN